MKQSNMIKTAAQYREFIQFLGAELRKTWDMVPVRERGLKAQKIAAELILSKTTVINYFSGFVADPETALIILEKFNEIYPSTSNQKSKK